jgi:hypothetical protein
MVALDASLNELAKLDQQSCRIVELRFFGAFQETSRALNLSPMTVKRHWASGLLCPHAIAITPAGSMELVRSSISIDCGLPCVTVRSAPAIVFSGPAQRSLMLWPARSPSRLATLSIKGSDSFVASAAASIASMRRS